MSVKIITKTVIYNNVSFIYDSVESILKNFDIQDRFVMIIQENPGLIFFLDNSTYPFRGLYKDKYYNANFSILYDRRLIAISTLSVEVSNFMEEILLTNNDIDIQNSIDKLSNHLLLCYEVINELQNLNIISSTKSAN